MFLPLILACSCIWSFQDFKNEINIQMYQISRQIEKIDVEDEALYNLGYLNGKLDVYKSLQEGLDQEPPETHP